MKSTFRKVLVANRGEIAIRVVRTCQELGMGTGAIFSDDDKKSFYYRIADEPVLLANETIYSMHDKFGRSIRELHALPRENV